MKITNEQRLSLLSKIELCNKGKIGASDVIIYVEDILTEYVEEATDYCEKIEKLVSHWRNKATQK